MSHDKNLENVNWDDTPFITFDLDDISQLPDDVQDQFDQVIQKVGTLHYQRDPENGVITPLHNALVVPRSHPAYAAARALVVGSALEEPAKPEIEQLYDVKIGAFNIHSRVTEKQAWEIIGQCRLGQTYIVYHSGTWEIAEDFVPL